ncbi:putative DNA binding domain-containing protein [Patescibacteria group bacterium]|nr:putative DNA binding domain-containing protein [Patescibacteria group bacterium]
MDDQNILKLIELAVKYRSETDQIEFKDGRGGLPRSAWKTISSFSQKPGGGVIVFGGIDDKANKKIVLVGLNNIAEIQEKFSDMNAKMSFTIRPEYHILEYDNKNLLAIVVPECPEQFKPCYYKPVGLPHGAYIRDGNTDRRMTEEEVRRLIALSKKLKIDRLKAKDVELEDLELGKITELLIKSGKQTNRVDVDHSPTFKVLKNLGIADDFNGAKAPTLGGFLIFAKDNNPQSFQAFSRYIIRCVRYKGFTVSSDIIDKIDIGGTLDYQIDEMQKFILRNIKKSAHVVGAKRFERYEYPEKAIREIVANAVIHRDYQITETYAQVNVFGDRIEVFNPGCLPPGVTIENIKDAQVSRNEVIATILKDMGYLEEYGRGIDIVFNKMAEWNLMKPIFKNTANSFKVILLGKELSKLNERQIKIWDHLIEKKRITAKECEKLLEGTPRPTINRDLKIMQDMNLIHPIGESVSTYYQLNF